MVKNSTLKFNKISTENSDHILVSVQVSKEITKKFYDFFANAETQKTNPYGFHQNTITPIEYIEKNLRSSILNQLKEFLIRYTVLNFLFKCIRENKINVIGSPLLYEITVEEDFSFNFIFKLVTAKTELVMDWRYSLFKFPERKKYKDLDKRAKEFLDEEAENEKNYNQRFMVDYGDWVCFEAYLCDENKKPILPELSSELWLKIGLDDINIPFQELFINRSIGDEFITNNQGVQEYFNSQSDTNHKYIIKINDIVHNKYFSIECFKKHFKIKTHKAAHQKIIEVFSLTNDLSLRKNIIEKLFDFLLKKYDINLPKHALIRQQKIVINALQEIPDYNVYKLQKNFQENIVSLARRQLEELALTDYISFNEELSIDHDDIKNYITLTTRPRTREFIYFKHSGIDPKEQEWPIPSELLKSMCLKEKTLNHIIEILS